MFELHNGNCLDVMAGIKAQSIDLICCDPPYQITSLEWDKILPFDQLWTHYERILKPSGAVLIFGNQPFTSKVVLSKEKWFKQCLVWDKNKCGSPGLAKIRPMQVHEDIIVFAPGRYTYNPQMEKGEPYERQSKNPEGYVGRCNNHGYGLKPKTGFKNEGTRYPKSIVRISRDFSAQQQVHPTQKPVPLLEWLIKTYSNKWDVVLDNTMGSGPTGVACVNTGRNFIGIEMDEVYFGIAKERIEKAKQLIESSLVKFEEEHV